MQQSAPIIEKAQLESWPTNDGFGFGRGSNRVSKRNQSSLVNPSRSNVPRTNAFPTKNNGRGKTRSQNKDNSNFASEHTHISYTSKTMYIQMLSTGVLALVDDETTEESEDGVEDDVGDEENEENEEEDINAEGVEEPELPLTAEASRLILNTMLTQMVARRTQELEALAVASTEENEDDVDDVEDDVDDDVDDDVRHDENEEEDTNAEANESVEATTAEAAQLIENTMLMHMTLELIDAIGGASTEESEDDVEE